MQKQITKKLNIKTYQYILIFILWGIFGLAKSSEAADYYVKNGGNDNLAGTSDETAWAHCPGLSGWTGSAKLSGGDTVYFRSQDSWTNTSTTTPTLQATAGVTYNGDTYGSGQRAKITTSVISSTYYLFSAVVQIWASNVTFKGFEVDINNAKLTGIHIGGSNDVTSNTIDNCDVHGNAGIQGVDWEYAILVTCNGGHTVYDTKIINSTVHDTFHEGIAIYDTWTSENNKVDGVLIRNCTAYNIGGNNGTSGGGAAVLICNDADNVTVEYCNLHDSPYTNGIWVRTSPDPTSSKGAPNNMVIRYNTIYGNLLGMSFSNTWGDAETGDIYGNLIYNNGAGRGSEISIGTSDWGSNSVLNFYNNTIFNNNSGTNGYGVEIGRYSNPILGTPTFLFKNNIIYTPDYPAFYDHYNLATYSHNLIYRDSSTNATAVIKAKPSPVAVPSGVITVSNDSSKTYFTKTEDGVDWTNYFNTYGLVSFSGFTSSNLNNRIFQIMAVSRNVLTCTIISSGGWGSETYYTDLNYVGITKWDSQTFTDNQISNWESNSKGSNPSFTGGVLPSGFTGTYGTDMVPNTNYFALGSASPAIDKGVNLGSPFNLSINSAGLSNPFTRPQGAAYEIGAYEYSGIMTGDTTPPASPTGFSVQ